MLSPTCDTGVLCAGRDDGAGRAGDRGDHTGRVSVTDPRQMSPSAGGGGSAMLGA